MNYFLGQIQALGCNYAPYEWALCQGQLMSIQQNTALFALIGTQFGGDGQQTFRLPDLRSRIVIGAGAGLGLTDYIQGEQVGAGNITLTFITMPMHTHTVANGGGGKLVVSDQPGTTDVPTAAINTLAVVVDGGGGNDFAYNPPGTAPDTALNIGPTSAPSQLVAVGSGTAFSIIQPVQAFTYAICLGGYYPTFN